MNVRQADVNELDEVFLMGYDAWGADLPMQMYIESCLASYKYRQGRFFVLEDSEGRLLSSCIVYPLSVFGGIVSERAVGIGSLATIAAERHKGYASLLLSLLMKLLEADGVDAFFIHADIHPKFYENLGFKPAPQSMQMSGGTGATFAAGTVPMLRLSGGRAVSTELWKELVMPAYF